MKHTYRKKWGQNFLHDPNIIRKIIERTQLKPGETVLEIGPGNGALTCDLALSASRVIAVEIDPLLVDHLNKNMPANVEVIQKDFMKFDLSRINSPYIIVGNLPYYITTPILFRILAHTGWVRCVLMVQKEVGERLFAHPGTKTYGRLSVMIQAEAGIHKEFIVPPAVFYPQPSVESIVVSMVPHRRTNINAEFFSDIVRLAFGQRRKKLRNTIAVYLSDDMMRKYGNMRPEMLTVAEFAEISGCCNIL